MSAATLAARVKAAREGAQLTMRGIEGVDHSQLSRIESGKVTDPGIATMTAIARATGKTVDELMGAPASAVRMIELRELTPDPNNPRTIGDDAADQAFVESIRTQGLLQALAVRRYQYPDSRNWTWLVVDGHRRYAALAAIHGPRSKQPVPCRVVVEEDGAKVLLLQLVANVQRADMNPWDLARGIGDLVAAGMDTQAIADALGRKRRWVQEQASVGKYLCLQAIEFLQKGELSISQAVAIAGQRDPDAQYFLTNRVMKERLNEDDIRALTADRKAQAKAKTESKQVDIEDLLDSDDEEIEQAAPKPVGGWKTWRSDDLGYFKWQMLKHPEREAYIIETQAQWRREGSATTGWGGDKRKYHDTQALALGDAFELARSEFATFAMRKDKATILTSFLPWLNKGMRNLRADEDLAFARASKFETWVQKTFPDEETAKAKPKGKAATKAAPPLKPPPAPPIDISEPPVWAMPMVGALFVVRDEGVAYLCKGWRHMAKTFADLGQADDDLRDLYDRDAWSDDRDGKPYDFGDEVVRLVDAPA